MSDDFRQRDAGTIWADVTNVVDGSGTATLSSSPATVRAGSKRNTITVTFTGTGTMDGGAVRFTIPEDWGAMQDDPLELNHIDVDVSGTGAALTDSEILDDGLQVVANLKTFGKGNKVTFTYGGGVERVTAEVLEPKPTSAKLPSWLNQWVVVMATLWILEKTT